MDGIDDDFGDIYADVEVQAASAVNAALGGLYIEPEDDDTICGGAKIYGSCAGKGAADSGSKNVDTTDIGNSCSGNGGLDEKVSALETDGSDSEDDLNIVLNDDDCQSFPVRGEAVAEASEDEDGDDCFGLEQDSSGQNGDRGNVAKGGYNSQFLQYKCARSRGPAHSSTAKANRAAGPSSFSSMLARGNWEDNRCNQSKGMSSSQVAYPYSNSFLGATQNGYGFSLPWYRTILEINIDTFEHKPWRHPGADITDFFNFGFDEESWKSYCNSLELIRQQSLSRTRNPAYNPKHDQAHEAELECQKVDQEGVAGEIVEAWIERLISPDTKYSDRELPKGRSIQVEGSKCERLPSMDVKRPRNQDSDVVIQIPVQDNMERSSDSPNAEDGGVDSTVQEHFKKGDFGTDDSMATKYFDKPEGESSLRNSSRCPPLDTSSNIMISKSVRTERFEISDMDGPHSQKKNVRNSDNDAEVAELVNDAKEEACRNSNEEYLCSLETESSLGERIDYSLNSSDFGSHSEASENDSRSDIEESEKSTRRSFPNVVNYRQEFRSSDFYSDKFPEINGEKMEADNCKGSARINTVIMEKQKNNRRRLQRVPKFHGGSNDVFPLSNKELSNCIAVDYRGEDDVGYYDRKDGSNHNKTEISPCHCGNRFVDNYVQTAYTKNLCRKGHQSLRDVRDSSFRKKWNGKDDFVEERIARVDKNMVDRDFYNHERLSAKDLAPHTYRVSKQVISKYCSYSDKKRDRWSRSNDELEFRIDSDQFVEFSNVDDIVDRYRRFAPFTRRERVLSDEKYDRRVWYNSRDDFGRREKYSSRSLDLDDPSSIKFDGEFWWHNDSQVVCSRSRGAPYISNGRWRDMPFRDDVYDSRSTELSGRFRRCRDLNWSDSVNDTYEHEDRIYYTEDDQVNDRENSGRQPKKLHLTVDIVRHRDDELCAEEAPFYNERSSRHENKRAKHECSDFGMLTNEKRLVRRRSGMTRESSDDDMIRSSNRDRRGKLEQTVSNCRDSVDLVVGEGKNLQSSGRSRKCGSACLVDNMYRKYDSDQIAFKDSNRCLTRKPAEPDILRAERNQNGEIWLDKHPIMECNEDLDVEEGQIVSEEPDKDITSGRSHTCESVAPMNGEKLLVKESSANVNKAAEGIDDDRILEMRLKMEKRRERFKEPIVVKKEPDQTKPRVDLLCKTGELRQRPARKRRWCGS